VTLTSLEHCRRLPTVPLPSLLIIFCVSCRSTDSQCFSMGRTIPQNCPFPWGSLPSPKYMISWARTSLPTNRHRDRFSRFCKVHECDQQTDTETIRPIRQSYCYSVCSNRPHLMHWVHAMWPNKACICKGQNKMSSDALIRAGIVVIHSTFAIRRSSEWRGSADCTGDQVWSLPLPCVDSKMAVCWLAGIAHNFPLRQSTLVGRGDPLPRPSAHLIP